MHRVTIYTEFVLEHNGEIFSVKKKSFPLIKIQLPYMKNVWEGGDLHQTSPLYIDGLP